MLILQSEVETSLCFLLIIIRDMEYLTSAECAKKWNISQRRAAIYCKEGRIKGAVMMGRMWMIPKNTEKPQDPRKKQK